MRPKIERIQPARVLALLMAVPVALIGSRAEAFETVNDHRLTYGVHNQYFWLDATAESNNHDAVVGGIDLWNATPTTPVWYLNTSTKSQSRLDFYRRSTPSNRYCATTTMWVNTTQVSPYAQNWWWAKVTIDPTLKTPAACGPAGHRAAMIAHEQGHAMGIDHNSSSSTLMYTYISETAVAGPKGDDIDAINYLY